MTDKLTFHNMSLTQRTQSSQRTAKRVRLDEVCEMNMGQSPDSKSYNQDRRGLPFYQGNADFGLLHPVPRYWCDCPTKIAEANDILISVRAPIGALNIADSKCCIGRGLASLRPASCCELLYLYYFLKANVAELNAKGTGSTFKAINKKSLAEVSVPLPPLSEQKRIAAALDKICEMRRNVESRLQKLDLLIKSRFNEMFGKDEYQEQELFAVTTFIDYRGKTPTKSGSGIPLITAKNVRSFGFSIEPREYIPESMYSEWMTRGFPKAGDVLFTTEAPLGNVCRIPNLYDKFAVGQRIVTMQPRSNILDATYLEFALRSGEFQRKMMQNSSGSTVTGIRSKLLEKLTIPLPPLPLQREFAAFVEKVEGMKAVAKKELEKVDLLYRAKLQEYFG